jgi:hypothetical protein
MVTFHFNVSCISLELFVAYSPVCDFRLFVKPLSPLATFQVCAVDEAVQRFSSFGFTWKCLEM